MIKRGTNTVLYREERYNYIIALHARTRASSFHMHPRRASPLCRHTHMRLCIHALSPLPGARPHTHQAYCHIRTFRLCIHALSPLPGAIPCSEHPLRRICVSDLLTTHSSRTLSQFLSRPHAHTHTKRTVTFEPFDRLISPDLCPRV